MDTKLYLTIAAVVAILYALAFLALPRSGRAKEVYDFTTIDELQLGERHDAVLVERGLE